MFQHLFVLVTFATGRFQIEDQILHVQTQLRQGFLDQVQNSTTTSAAFHDSSQSGCNGVTIACGQCIDGGSHFLQFNRSFVVEFGGVVCSDLGHKSDFPSRASGCGTKPASGCLFGDSHPLHLRCRPPAGTTL
ncbi:hypothetical protein RB1617 [Rhodopirellula baltica SH 1]|uniref:Uncharacterized protein n=1 Tax=Rhodopirellula baltica (strain DSM 10527 / NCIMB 13988 / SH1) TaxID=243090 RepID=Q7UX21_RHOBA|nr:hypothetical protein RB1617 [Rhodopirellula baltica SH 1]